MVVILGEDDARLDASTECSMAYTRPFPPQDMLELPEEPKEPAAVA